MEGPKKIPIDSGRIHEEPIEDICCRVVVQHMASQGSAGKPTLEIVLFLHCLSLLQDSHSAIHFLIGVLPHPAPLHSRTEVPLMCEFIVPHSVGYSQTSVNALEEPPPLP